MTKKQKKVLYRILISALLLIPANLTVLPGPVRILLYGASYLVIGYDILKKAFKGIKNRRVLDESFLMTVATLGAIALAALERSLELNEAVAVMLFYQIGELFQSVAVGKSRGSISALMDIRPDYANIEENGALVRVDPEEVEPGSEILVQPGEKIPLDGVILEGTSSLNTSSLTGESLPRDVTVGDGVISGCVNMTGLLRVKTTGSFEESTVSKILELVENASSHKSRSENFISRFARIYTPVVCGGALGLALLPPIVRMLMGMPGDWSVWIYRALTFLVISCPCALVISIPLGFFAGLGGASREGILIKGSNYLETLSQVHTVVFDKTGTLTQGVFEVRDIHRSPLEREQLLEYAALVESASSHPISKSLREAHGKRLDRSRVAEVTEIGGGGVHAKVDGKTVAAGNTRLMEQLGVAYHECPEDTGTVVHMAVDGDYAGHILISDCVKPTSQAAVEALKRCGVKNVVMLTGDQETAAEQVRRELKLDACHSGLLPADKVTWVDQMLSDPDTGKLAFVGDGVNDAPVLARADVGIAMGAMGSDAAIEAADVVLMDDDPGKVAKAIRIARKCMRIVRENIVFALAVKLLCLILGALGLAGMWAAIFADVGVMVLAVLNAIRAMYVKNV